MDSKELKMIERRKDETLNDMRYYEIQLKETAVSIGLNPYALYSEVIAELAKMESKKPLCDYVSLMTQYENASAQHEVYYEMYNKAYGFHEVYLDKD